MKKTITLFMLLMVFIPGIVNRSYGQLAVVDPTLMASNIIGFGEELSQGITSLSALAQALNVAKSTYDNIKAGVDAVKKVSNYVYNLKCAIEAAQDIVNIERNYYDSYNAMTHSGVYSLPEISSFMDIMTNQINTVTGITKDLINYVSPGSVQATDVERKTMMEADAKQILSFLKDSQIKLSQTKDQIANRKAIRVAQSINGLSPLSLCYLTANPDAILPSVYLAPLIESLEDPEAKPMTSTEAAKQIDNLYTPIDKLLWMTTIVLLLLGAFRVYKKIVMDGEDPIKVVAIWGSIFFMMLVISLIYHNFFSSVTI